MAGDAPSPSPRPQGLPAHPLGSGPFPPRPAGVLAGFPAGYQSHPASQPAHLAHLDAAEAVLARCARWADEVAAARDDDGGFPVLFEHDAPAPRPAVAAADDDDDDDDKPASQADDGGNGRSSVSSGLVALLDDIQEMVTRHRAIAAAAIAAAARDGSQAGDADDDNGHDGNGNREPVSPRLIGILADLGDLVDRHRALLDARDGSEPEATS
ncbi:hypothetical protein GGTG_07724 [Gaeumannomyces tritici R3-111a-1]|uniref:Uncharacterized protein n=1 Tax=Gaeumannomyces tritici (strain R3-111a-1) TaxID=644352 RepID=J3P2H8_GAET3|nr:hypothetical protein GGTG_07724 [Gaeumannomyces tritici R3-111a-1]EJT73870.1 hypothetical protein GGTG_07724 [Gaeumannomyces tritici R3-111a-1]